MKMNCSTRAKVFVRNHRIRSQIRTDLSRVLRGYDKRIVGAGIGIDRARLITAICDGNGHRERISHAEGRSIHLRRHDEVTGGRAPTPRYRLQKANAPPPEAGVES